MFWKKKKPRKTLVHLPGPRSICLINCKMGEDRICRGCGATYEEKIEWFTASMDRREELALMARTRLLSMKNKNK
jgi:predicted Fe-S protein YdhL (DUF1289 family)